MFSHLHLHSEFSILDGLGQADVYAKKAKELGQKYLACTDHGNVDGLITFQKACKNNGIIPILGCEVYYVPDATVKVKGETRSHLTMLIKNEAGWKSMCNLLNYANSIGFYNRPRVDEDILFKNLDGLVVMTGCVATPLMQPYGRNLLERLSKQIRDDLYVEIMPHYHELQDRVNKVAYALALEFDLPTVSSNDVHYCEKHHETDHEILLAIQSKKKWSDKDRFRFDFKGLHMRSEEEMRTAFHRQGVIPEEEYNIAIEVTQEIAEKCCNFTIAPQSISLPKYPDGNVIDFLNRDSRKRYKVLFGHPLNENDTYLNRLNLELDLIEKKGFGDYFWIVYDLVNFCKENSILTGSGRGSIGGSLLAYLLGITSVDPIKYGLLFERFMSAERNDYPDIDLDFDSNKRSKVRDYLARKYGEGNVIGVSTFGKMKARSVIRDIGRVFGLDERIVDECAKTIDKEGKEEGEGGEYHCLALKKALTETEEGKRFANKYPQETEHAYVLAGKIRSAGQHASALIITKESFLGNARGIMVTRKGKSVINWSQDETQHMGLIKFDILGLSALSIYDEARRLIKLNHGTDINFESIKIDDKKVLDAFAQGNTYGIFQFHSPGITKLCIDMKIKTFMDLVHINALYRPGTLRSGMVDEYLARKNKGKKAKLHPVIDEITRETYGVIIYQEQVMKIANLVAGMTWGKADEIRKVVAKSKGKEAMKKYEEAFVSGCVNTSGIPQREAAELWNTIEAFGLYQFNMSHSVEYTMMAYWGQWLKVYYEPEFLAANLTYGDEKDSAETVKAAKKSGYKIKLPKLEFSAATNWTTKDKNLYCPFSEIKGIGEVMAKKAADMKAPKRKGFFNEYMDDGKPSKLKDLLSEIGAFDIEAEPTPDIQKYFSFNILNDQTSLYPNLAKLYKKFGTFDFESIEWAITGLIAPDVICASEVTERSVAKFKPVLDNIRSCADCGLRKQCEWPVLPSLGVFNIAIIGEAPGLREHESNKGFVGKSGDIVWESIETKGCRREDFLVTNVCKCWPSLSKTPTKEEIDRCKPHLKRELSSIGTRLALVFGNTNLYCFKGEESGITKYNAATEWNEEFGLWACYCIHPAAVLRDPNKMSMFEAGIDNFVRKIDLLQDDLP